MVEVRGHQARCDKGGGGCHLGGGQTDADQVARHPSVGLSSALHLRSAVSAGDRHLAGDGLVAADRRAHQLMTVQLRTAAPRHRPPNRAPPRPARPRSRADHHRQTHRPPRPLATTLTAYPLTLSEPVVIADDVGVLVRESPAAAYADCCLSRWPTSVPVPLSCQPRRWTSRRGDRTTTAYVAAP